MILGLDQIVIQWKKKSGWSIRDNFRSGFR